MYRQSKKLRPLLVDIYLVVTSNTVMEFLNIHWPFGILWMSWLSRRTAPPKFLYLLENQSDKLLRGKPLLYSSNLRTRQKIWGGGKKIPPLPFFTDNLFTFWIGSRFESSHSDRNGYLWETMRELKSYLNKVIRVWICQPQQVDWKICTAFCLWN